MSKRIPILLGLILVLLAIWVFITPTKTIRQLVERLEHLSYDLQLRTWVMTNKYVPLSPVAIVDIDDRSLQTEGHWPWPRSKLGKLVDQLKKQGAAVIAFDMFFAESQPNIAQEVYNELAEKNILTPSIADLLTQNKPLFDEDDIFAKSLQNTDTVLALGFLPREEKSNVLPAPILTLNDQEHRDLDLNTSYGYISNIPTLQQAAKGAGFINIFPDNDGIIRRAPLLIEYNNNVYPALALQAITSFLGEKVTLITPTYGDTIKLEGIHIGNRTIPTDEKGQMLIPFVGHSFTFPFYSAHDVLEGKVPNEAIAGKILFIGTSATGLGDLKATAIQNPFPGVEIQATIVNGILEQQFSYQPAWTFGANLFFAIVAGIFGAFIFPYLGPRTLAAIIILLPPAMIFFNNWLWHRTGLILSFLMPILLVLTLALLNIIYGYLFETRKRERLKEMFGQYVPEKHIDEMLQTTSDYALRGEDREMTVLFADIRNFTTISEGMPATELVDMLNTYFTPMTEIIFKHRGTIDKYVGDLIMAFWGAPLKDRHHTRHAIQSALEMQEKVKSLATMLVERKWPALKIGIGINSGLMSVGDMGSKFRRNYTVLGDAVNLASRVESLTKFYGVSIIVTEYAEMQQTKFIFRPLDKVRVKGKKHSITIYEVIGNLNSLTAPLKLELDLYQQGLNFYYQQKWEEAENIFLQLSKQYPETKIYHIYIKRINEFKGEPPHAEWDGVFEHHEK